MVRVRRYVRAKLRPDSPARIMDSLLIAVVTAHAPLAAYERAAREIAILVLRPTEQPKSEKI